MELRDPTELRAIVLGIRKVVTRALLAAGLQTRTKMWEHGRGFHRQQTTSPFFSLWVAEFTATGVMVHASYIMRSEIPYELPTLVEDVVATILEIETDYANKRAVCDRHNDVVIRGNQRR